MELPTHWRLLGWLPNLGKVESGSGHWNSAHCGLTAGREASGLNFTDSLNFESPPKITSHRSHGSKSSKTSGRVKCSLFCEIFLFEA